MTANMDVSLDEMLAERKTERRGNRGRGDRNNDRGDRGDRNDRNGGRNGGGRRDRDRRDDYPRDGVRKSYRDEPRKIDEEWVHDRYDNNDSDHHVKSSRNRASPERTRGTRVRVDNLHYDLTKDDLEGLFSSIGSVASVDLVYDRAGRSEGTAYVTYHEHDDARAALREFDGANAKGQPIRLSIVPAGGRGGGGRGGGNGALGSGRPLADRISRPRKRGGDNDEEEGEEGDDGRTSLAVAARRGIDRYVPGSGSSRNNYNNNDNSGRLSRSRSPAPRRRDGGGGGGGRRPGERRGGGRNGRGDNRNDGQNGRRSRKTQEELDAEMADYFVEGSNGNGVATGDAAALASASAEAAPAAAAVAPADDGDDTDMIL